MKRIALVAALLLGSSAFAQTASTSDANAVEADTDAGHATAETSPADWSTTAMRR